MRTRFPKPETNCPSRARLPLPKIIFSGTDNSKFTIAIHHRDTEAAKKEFKELQEFRSLRQTVLGKSYSGQKSRFFLQFFRVPNPELLIRFDGVIDLSGSLGNEKSGNRV